MPIAAVVVTLDTNVELRAHALRQMAEEPRVELGGGQSSLVPAVLETKTGEEGEALVNELLIIPGVLRIELVSVDFSCDEAC